MSKVSAPVRVRSVDRWTLMFLSDSVARYLLLRFYFFQVDIHISEAAQIIVYVAVFLFEMVCLFLLLWELNSVAALIQVARAFIALEVLKSSSSIILCIHNATLFKSATKFCLSVVLLLGPAIFDIFIRIHGYRLASLRREPYHAESLGHPATVSMDVWNNEDSPLSMAYRNQRDQRPHQSEDREAGDRSSCSTEDQPLLQDVFSRQRPSSSIEVHSDAAARVNTRSFPILPPQLPQESRPVLPGQQSGAGDDAVMSSPRSSFQTYPHFHLRTRTFDSNWVEMSIGLAIATTALELLLAVSCATFGHCMGVNLVRHVVVPAVASVGSFVALLAVVARPRAVFAAVPFCIGACLLRPLSVADCDGKCTDLRTTPMLLVPLQIVQAFNIATLVPIALVPIIIIYLRRRACACCGLKSCIREEALDLSSDPIPYSQWKRRKALGLK